MPGSVDRSVPDTNVVLRYLLRDVPESFAEAERYFEKVRAGKEKALLLESVIAESVYVLTKSYGVPKAGAVSALSGLLHYKGVVNEDRAVLIDALDLFGSQNLDLVDCLVLAKAKAVGARVVTFDKALAKAAKTRLPGT